MSLKGPDPLKRRITDAKRLLAAQLEGDGGAEETKKLVDQLELLEGLARSLRRRRSVLWVTGAVAVALTAAALLRFSFLDQVDMALVAETKAFVFLNGDATRNILPASVLLGEVTAPGQQIARCTNLEASRPFDCEPVLALRLNTVFINAETTTVVRRIGSCIEISVLGGGASADISTLLSADTGRAPVQAPEWIFDHLDLRPGESFSFCAIEETALQCDGIVSMTVGDRLEGGLSEQEDTPTLSKASLSLPGTAQSTTFLGTDIPRFSGLVNGVAVARLGDPMQVSLVGKAKRMTVETGAHQKNLMPSRLDWLRGSPALKALLALLAAIFGAAVAVRERWLGEFG